MLSDTVLSALITAVPALGALVVSILTYRKIEVVHKATNSMKDALVSTTKSDSFQKGHTSGVADEKAKPS